MQYQVHRYPKCVRTIGSALLVLLVPVFAAIEIGCMGQLLSLDVVIFDPIDSSSHEQGTEVHFSVVVSFDPEQVVAEPEWLLDDNVIKQETLMVQGVQRSPTSLRS